MHTLPEDLYYAIRLDPEVVNLPGETYIRAVMIRAYHEGRETADIEDKRKAALWDALLRMCGHYQNSTERAVTLDQDDAARTHILSLGQSRRTSVYFGTSLADCIAKAIAAGEDKED